VAIVLGTPGVHNVQNALAAAAIGIAAGAGWQAIIAGLSDFRPQAKRMELRQTTAGIALLNDAYNANPGSMAAGLRTLRQMAKGKTVALLGDMRELGASAPEAHFAIGALLAELAIDFVGIAGEFRADVARGAASRGPFAGELQTFADKAAMVTWINELVAVKKLGKDDLILVKASRGLRFETVVSALVGETH
jgi:UDP-N-acetylmuramyl pentapeptide synthase